MMTTNWKKTLNLIKDRTTIGIVKIASSRAPDLDVAIVKATSHDDVAFDEKYLQEILRLTAISLSSAHACLQSLTKRIGKTRDWVVALKVLIVTHRLLREGNPVFEDDLKLVSRRCLNTSNFNEDSQSNSWDYSTFVRSYSAYLDARLDCDFSANIAPKFRSQHDDNLGFSSRRNAMDMVPYDGDKSHRPSYREQKDCIKEMKPDLLIKMLPSLQGMIDRVLACRPTGAAKNHRLVHIALYMIVRESFQLFSELCEGIGALLNVYFDMKVDDCSRTFNIYERFAKQSDALSYFYKHSKSMGICRPSEYPLVDKVSPEYLEILEDFLANRCRSQPNNTRSFIPESEKFIHHITYESVYGMKALPAPQVETPQIIAGESTSCKALEQPDLIDLGSDEGLVETGDDKMALTVFQSSSVGSATTGWVTFDTASHGVPQNSSTVATKQQNAASVEMGNIGLSGWELALVSEASKSANPEPLPMVGNFDRHSLESLYNQGSTSSFAVFPRPHYFPFLELPAPGPSTSHDPLAASQTAVLPAYFQIPNLPEQQRNFLPQQQQFWQQPVNGPFGNYGSMQSYSMPYTFSVVGRPARFVAPYYGITHGYGQTK